MYLGNLNQDIVRQGEVRSVNWVGITHANRTTISPEVRIGVLVLRVGSLRSGSRGVWRPKPISSIVEHNISEVKVASHVV